VPESKQAADMFVFIDSKSSQFYEEIGRKSREVSVIYVAAPDAFTFADLVLASNRSENMVYLDPTNWLQR